VPADKHGGIALKKRHNPWLRPEASSQLPFLASIPMKMKYVLGDI